MYIKSPIEFVESEGLPLTIKRELDDRIKMLDNLVELIVYTPRGSLSADPDFGFEYWNYEYSNVHSYSFNNGYQSVGIMGLHTDSTKLECESSIRRSLRTYGPCLKNVDVSISLKYADNEKLDLGKKAYSKYEVIVRVMGVLEDGLGTLKPYEKKVSFLMEPTVKYQRR